MEISIFNISNNSVCANTSIQNIKSTEAFVFLFLSAWLAIHASAAWLQQRPEMVSIQSIHHGFQGLRTLLHCEVKLLGRFLDFRSKHSMSNNNNNNNSSPEVVDPIRTTSCSEQPAWKPNQGGVFGGSLVNLGRTPRFQISWHLRQLDAALLLGPTTKIWASRCKRNAVVIGFLKRASKC